MLPITLPLIDGTRSNTPSGSMASPSPATSVPAEMQQRFERLLTAKPKEPMKENNDTKVKYANKSSMSIQGDTPPTNSMLLEEGQLPCETPATGEDYPFLADAYGPVVSKESNDSPADTLSIRSLDSSIPELTSDESDQGADSDSLETPAVLPSPFELFSKGGSTTELTVASTDRIQSTAESRLIDLARQVADRILVSDAVNANREVRIQVKEAILPGTEIRLSERAGHLQVNLITDQKSSLDFLLQQQGELNARLEQYLARDVVVHVDFDSTQPFDSQQPFGSHSSSSGSDDYDAHDGETDDTE